MAEGSADSAWNRLLPVVDHFKDFKDFKDGTKTMKTIYQVGNSLRTTNLWRFSSPQFAWLLVFYLLWGYNTLSRTDFLYLEL